MKKQLFELTGLLFMIIIVSMAMINLIQEDYSNKKDKSSVIEKETNISTKVKKIKFNGDVDTLVMRLTYKDNSIFYLTGKDSRYFYVDQISGEVYFEANQEYKEKKTFYITGVAKDPSGAYISKDYEIETPYYVEHEGLDLMFFLLMFLPLLFLLF